MHNICICKCNKFLWQFFNQLPFAIEYLVLWNTSLKCSKPKICHLPAASLISSHLLQEFIINSPEQTCMLQHFSQCAYHIQLQNTLKIFSNVRKTRCAIQILLLSNNETIHWRLRQTGAGAGELARIWDRVSSNSSSR